MAAVTYGYAITTYVGLNLGAKNYQRIRKGVHGGTYMALLTAVVISACFFIIYSNYSEPVLYGFENVRGLSSEFE